MNFKHYQQNQVKTEFSDDDPPPLSKFSIIDQEDDEFKTIIEQLYNKYKSSESQRNQNIQPTNNNLNKMNDKNFEIQSRRSTTDSNLIESKKQQQNNTIQKKVNQNNDTIQSLKDIENLSNFYIEKDLQKISQNLQLGQINIQEYKLKLQNGDYESYQFWQELIRAEEDKIYLNKKVSVLYKDKIQLRYYIENQNQQILQLTFEIQTLQTNLQNKNIVQNISTNKEQQLQNQLQELQNKFQNENQKRLEVEQTLKENILQFQKLQVNAQEAKQKLTHLLQIEQEKINQFQQIDLSNSPIKLLEYEKTDKKQIITSNIVFTTDKKEIPINNNKKINNYSDLYVNNQHRQQNQYVDVVQILEENHLKSNRTRKSAHKIFSDNSDIFQSNQLEIDHQFNVEKIKNMIQSINSEHINLVKEQFQINQH